MKLKGTLILFCLFVLIINSSVMGQEQPDIVAIRAAFAQAIDDHDVDAILSHFTDDGVSDATVFPTPLTTPEQMRAMWEDQFNSAPDWHTEDGRVLTDGNIVVVEHAAVGTNTGESSTGPPTGLPWTWPHLDVYEFEGDKIKRLMSYGDYAGILVQLGMMPAPDMPDLTPSFVLPAPEPTGLSPIEAATEMLARWSSNDPVALAKIVHQDMSFNGAGVPATLDRNAYIGLNEVIFFPAFSGLVGQPISMVDLGDGWVITEILFTGTHDGAYLGIPATGRPVVIRGAALVRVDAQGLMTDLSLYFDNLSLMTVLTATSFTDFGSGSTTELFAGGATWQVNWGQGPWTWSESTGEPLLDSNVSAVMDLRTTGPADISADLMATLPIGGTVTITAHDAHFPEVVTGTMVLSGVGMNVIDINASRVIVDEGSGMFLAPFHPPGPQVMLTLEQATGVFGHITQVGPWELVLAGSYAVPLVPGAELQDNIFTALGGEVALIGGIGEFSLSGLYAVDAAKLPQDFCEYGTASTERLAPDGGGWNQQWGMAGPLDWIECAAETSVPFLNENVTGILTTYVIGLPDISPDMILHIPLAGQMVITEHSADNPDEVIGQMTFDVLAMFVADMNAERAVVNEAEGTITIAFGASVEEGPDGLMTLTEATGSLADIKQVSPWEWHVNGTMQCVRVPELPLQTNLLAVLQQSELLLGAEEEFALTGAYYHSAPQE
jgi:predicted ester cyclase